MNIFEIEKILPNGFHDIVINKLTIDYENRTLSMIIEVDETGREVELFFSGMRDLSINKETLFNGETLWVTDFGSNKSIIDHLRSYSYFYFYISNLNAFLNFKIDKAELREVK